MRLSQFYFHSLKETPQEAELISHQLMLRANMIKQTASGIYTWLPLGLKVLRKVEAIVREEMNAAGALELLMPITQPAELWQESERWQDYGAELLRFEDRHQRFFCLGPTHEEVISDIARREIQSYKELPVNLYQIQMKFRDEIRPRFGVMRAREFLMKDAYSFHVDQSCLQETYQKMVQAYTNIFDRLRLDFRAVSADSGSIGGDYSHEFHVLADSGEDALAFSTVSDYCANVELAPSICEERRAEAQEKMQLIDTANAKTIRDVSKRLGIEVERCLKLLLVEGNEESGSECVAIVMRGDHELNEIKAEKHPLIKAPLTFATPEMAIKILGCGFGSLGPVGIEVPLLVDAYAAAVADFCCGANQEDKHYTGVNWGKDLPEPQVADLRTVEKGDKSPDGQGKLDIRRGIEVGHIFQLGEKYSQAMNVSVQDENGKEIKLLMGCYGVGVSRIVAAAIEQNHDDRGIIWPAFMAPWQVHLIPINVHKSAEVLTLSEQIYANLTTQGIEVVMDDRDLRLGNKFADADLIGCPLRVVVSDKGIAESKIEYQTREGSEKQFFSLQNWQEEIEFLIADSSIIDEL